MLAMPGNTGEAEPFLNVATEILAANPVAD
jgi:hypothetical protein